MLEKNCEQTSVLASSCYHRWRFRRGNSIYVRYYPAGRATLIEHSWMNAVHFGVLTRCVADHAAASPGGDGCDDHTNVTTESSVLIGCRPSSGRRVVARLDFEQLGAGSAVALTVADLCGCGRHSSEATD